MFGLFVTEGEREDRESGDGSRDKMHERGLFQPCRDSCGAKKPPRSRAALLLQGRGAVEIDSYGAMRTVGSEYGE
jgi:hypothetical protein